ncbi:hypothetical protein ACKVWC_003421 [Pyricularia oryzae]
MTKELQNGGLAAPVSHQPVQPIVSDSVDYQLWQIIQKASSSRQENAQKEQRVQQLWAEHTSLRKEIRDLKEQQDAIKSKLGKALEEQKTLELKLTATQKENKELRQWACRFPENAQGPSADTETDKKTEQQLLDCQVIAEQHAQDSRLLQEENKGLRERLKAFEERGKGLSDDFEQFEAQNNLLRENGLLRQKYEDVLRELVGYFPDLQEDAGNLSLILAENAGRAKRKKRN